MPRDVQVNEAVASRRRVYFDLRDATDGLSPELSEANGQPQISTDSGAWTNVGIGTLSAIGNGRYSADLSVAAIGTFGEIIETRYKSAATAETPGDTIQVVSHDPIDSGANIIAALEDAGLILGTTTIATLAAQSDFTLTDGPPDDDVLKDAILVIEQAGTPLRKTVALVLAYTGLTKRVNLANSFLLDFEIAVGDKVRIITGHPGIPNVPFATGGGLIAGQVGIQTLVSLIFSDTGVIKAKTGMIGSGMVTVTSPVALDQNVTLVKGDDYRTIDSRALDFINAAGSWPDLTGATIKFKATHSKSPGQTFAESVGLVIVPVGLNQQVRIEIEGTDTASLPAGSYEYDVEATLSNGNTVTLVSTEGKQDVDLTLLASHAP